MRRSLILAASIAMTTVAVMLATAPPAAPIVMCPLAGAHPAAVPNCCGPPIVQSMRSDLEPAQPCCPSNAMCLSTLSISSSPNPSIASRKVVISGSLPSGSTATGGPVTIWQRVAGESQFSKLTDATPDASGSYSVSQNPDTNRQWYATANGLRSITIAQQVQAQVTFTGSVDKGGMYTFHARVSPSHGHQRIVIQMRSRKRWTVLARPRLSAQSAASLGVSFSWVRLGGRVTFRAMFAGDARNTASMSAAVSLPKR